MAREAVASRVRKRLGGALIEGALTGLSRAVSLHPKVSPERHGVTVYRNIPYLGTGDAAHTLDIYQPASVRSGTPSPVCFYIHGGGFRILSKDTHWWAGLLFAAKQGYTVFNINYRLAPKHRFPAAIEDCAAALEWVLDNGKRFGADPSQLVFAGESAGANLSLVLTLGICYQRPEAWARSLWERCIVPKAVLPACGLLQVSDKERFSKNNQLPVWVSDRIEEICESYLPKEAMSPSSLELADPLLIVESGRQPVTNLPPMFLSCGGRDPVLSDTQRLELALRAMGVECEARYYPDGHHAFHAMLWREDARQHWSDAFSFLSNVVG